MGCGAGIGIVVCIAALSLTGYIYGASQLYQIPQLTGIALQTASIIFALGAGVIAAVSEYGLGAALTRGDAGGAILRRLIVPVILLPVLIGWLRLRGEMAGYYDTAFGSAARSLCEIGFLLGLLWWTARGISRSDAALRRREAELNEAQHLAHIGGWNWEARTDFVTGSDELYRIYGLNPKTEKFPDFKNQRGTLYPGESWDRINQAAMRTLQTGGGYELDVDAFRKGQRIYVTTRGEAVRDATGQIVGLSGTVQDITERRGAEAAVRESEKRYRSLFESIDEGFCVVEVIFDSAQQPVDYRFLEMNPAFEQHTGLANARGKTIREMIPNHDPHWFETYGNVALTGEAIRFENYSAPMDRWFNVYAFRIGRPEERKVALLFADITERKRAEEAARQSQRELAAANEQLALANAQLASRAKQLDSLVEQRTAKLREAVADLEAFSYSMAHDLRGPLRTLQGFANILTDDYGPQIDETGRAYLERIGSAADRMNWLISDVLKYSRISSEPFALEPVELKSVVHEATEQNPALKQTSIRVRESLPAVLGNRAALTQVLSNLLTNATKFVSNGNAAAIEVSAERETDWVTLSVRDNGIGIAPEHHERIFRMFERIHSEKKFEGTGIGLAIVRRAVERMGGTVGVESRLGEGSRFWVKLKCAEKSDTDRPIGVGFRGTSVRN